MIEVYRPVDCPTCANIEATLKELTLARKIITVEPGQQPEALPAGTPLPAIKDEGRVISEPAAIEAYLVELKKIAYEWRKFQMDSCYVDLDDDPYWC